MGRTLGCLGLVAALAANADGTYQGLTIAPENRCSPYDADDYSYPQSVEPRIVDTVGTIYGPYTGTCFDSIRETDIEHIVARSEAHDSGLCGADAATRRAFARDLLNLTLASPRVNRHQKVDKDVAEWTPMLNACWFVERTIEVRRKYALTIDAAEAEAAERVLSGCASTEMVIACDGVAEDPFTRPRALRTAILTKALEQHAETDVDALALWDDNGNGRITCAEARRHGIAPVERGHPAYRYMRDGDGDGVVCE